MKKICFFIDDISQCGGTERVCLMIANELCRFGYEVRILNAINTRPSFFECDSRISLHTLLSNPIERKLKYKKWYKRWKMRRLLLHWGTDVVIDVDTTLSNITIPAALGTSVRTISWDHYSYYKAKEYQPRMDALELIKKNNVPMVVLSKADWKLYTEKENVNPKQVYQIYNPLTFESDTYIKHDSKKVISVGRFTHQKGFDLLLKAWSLVEAKRPDWCLEIWGDNGLNMSKQLHELKDELCLQHVSLRESIRDVRSKMEDASIYVLSSRFEGLGIVLLEAAATSLPLVSFNCLNGPKEIVEDGKNGFLVKPEDIEEMADKLMVLMENKELRDKMGMSAFETSKRFKLSVIMEQWIKLIESL